MSKEQKIKAFNPNGPGHKNNRFIGLPFDEEEASIVLLPVPWDVTASSSAGTSRAPENILNASYQLDLLDPDVPDAWKMGIFLRQENPYWKQRNGELRPISEKYINFLESGGLPDQDKKMQKALEDINQSCRNLKNWVYEETRAILKEGKLVGIVGGDHSVPLGFLEALSERYLSFGILQIDAHMDLREAYQGFHFSHASIIHNAIKIKNLKKVVQAGIRDYCEEEIQVPTALKGKIVVYADHDIRRKQYQGTTFEAIVMELLAALPKQVYISFDIDGLSPHLCPNTGTPVPGGLEYQEVIFLLDALVRQGKEIIGFDLCEVAGPPHEWDGNVGARILYKLCNLMGKSRNF